MRQARPREAGITSSSSGPIRPKGSVPPVECRSPIRSLPLSHPLGAAELANGHMQGKLVHPFR